jgi:hypothetical protein
MDLTAVPLARGGRLCVDCCCAAPAHGVASLVWLRCVAGRYREEQPRFIAPMPLTSGAVPDAEQWAPELKWDGCRAQLHHDGRSVSVRTRSGRSCSAIGPRSRRCSATSSTASRRPPPADRASR